MIRQPFTVKLGDVDVPNRNHRIYTTEVLEKALTAAADRLPLRGEFGFPEKEPGEDTESYSRRAMQIDERRVSHEITDIEIVDNCLMGKIKILDTPYGRLLDETLLNEHRDFRMRGFTTFTTDSTTRRDGCYEIATLELITFDATSDGA